MSLAVIVPVRDERSTLGGVLDGLQALAVDEIVVVDDGSCDGSGAIALGRGVRVMRHDRARGYGASLKAGLAATRSDNVAIIDGDGTYDPADLARLVQALPPGGMAVGVREEPSRARRLIKALFRLQVQLFGGAQLPDLNSGLRVFDRRVAARLAAHLPDRFSFTTTLTLGALAQSQPLRFVPVHYSQRRCGRSKFEPSDALRMGVTVARGTGWLRRRAVGRDPALLPRLRWLAFALAVVAVAIVAARWDLGSLWWPCSLGMLGYLPFFAAKLVRWQRLLCAVGVRLSFGEALWAYLSGMAVGAVTPGRAGELLRIAGPASRGHCIEGLAVATIVDRLMDLAVVGAVALAAVWLTAAPSPSWIAIAAGVALGALALLWATPTMVAFIGRRLLGRPLEKPPALRLSTLIEAGAWSLLSMSTFFAIAMMLLASSGNVAPLAALAGAVAFGNLASLLPVSVAGLGTREGAVAAALLAAGYVAEPSSLVAYSLGFHAVFTLTPWALLLAFGLARVVKPARRWSEARA
jgi:polyisoprenyl-phosphate glycosyltransferase